MNSPCISIERTCLEMEKYSEWVVNFKSQGGTVSEVQEVLESLLEQGAITCSDHDRLLAYYNSIDAGGNNA